MDIPETRYAKTSDGVHIAYQVVGDALMDLVFVMGWTSNIEAMWEEPALARFLSRLASFSRLILFDKRGTGLSDRVPDDKLPSLETRMDDVRAVMDAVGSERAVVFGVSEGGPMAIVFAATYPERTTALVLFGTAARFAWAPDFPWGVTSESHARALDEIDRSWGTREHAVRELRDWAAPSLAGDERMVSWLDSYLRRAASPGAAAALERMNHEIDVRQVLSAVRVPSLVVARIGDRDFDIAATREMSGAIPGARLIELPGDDHFFWVGDADSVLDAVQSFVASIRDEETEFDRVLASVLFTDVVGSTEKAAELGDRGWRDLVERHHATVRAMLARYRGTEVDTVGDGFFATFDGPARAVRCAQAIVEAVRPLGIDVRAGVHTGEVETIDTKVGGIAVVIASRIASMAEAAGVLASSTVKDLTAGSGLVFEDAGEQDLKGVPDRWRLYRVVI